MNDTNTVFTSELQPDERIVWSGQPTPKLFSKSDYVLIPFSIMWCAFAIYWEWSVIRFGAPVFMAAFGVPFVALGLYMVFGRFIYKKYRKQHTYYALTDQRALIAVTKDTNKHVETTLLRNVSTISKTADMHGIGTIRFGNANTMEKLYGNSGMEQLGGYYGTSTPTFYDIADVDEVYSKTKAAQ